MEKGERKRNGKREGENDRKRDDKIVETFLLKNSSQNFLFFYVSINGKHFETKSVENFEKSENEK